MADSRALALAHTAGQQTDNRKDQTANADVLAVQTMLGKGAKIVKRSQLPPSNGGLRAIPKCEAIHLVFVPGTHAMAKTLQQILPSCRELDGFALRRLGGDFQQHEHRLVAKGILLDEALLPAVLHVPVRCTFAAAIVFDELLSRQPRSTSHICGFLLLGLFLCVCLAVVLCL